MKRSDPEGVQARIEALCAQYGLSSGAVGQLGSLLESLADEHAPTAVKDPHEAVHVHLADSLSGLVHPEVAGHRGTICDMGSGCGMPGVPLALALPDASVVAVEAIGKRCDFISTMAAGAGITNVEVVKARAEEWAEGIGTCSLVVARALAPLPVIVEYSAPLLDAGGVLVAWKGRPTRDELDAGTNAASTVGLEPIDSVDVEPWPGGGVRCLVGYRKVSETPERFPRRAGMAAKRPLGAG